MAIFLWEPPEPPAPTFRHLGTRWPDRIRSSALLSELAGIALLLKLLLRRGSVEARLTDMVIAARRLSSRPLRTLLRRLLRPWQSGKAARVWRDRRIGWDRYHDELQSPRLAASLVLKAPAPHGEKGVLYCPFEYNWLRLASHPNGERLLNDYVFVGASSWSPPDYAAMMSLSSISRDPVFVGVSNQADVEAYRILAPAVRAVPLMASDWIDPACYAPGDFAARDIDILMVANFSSFQRHWLLFRALSRMRHTLRVTLIGFATPGRGEHELRTEARAMGVTQDLEILTNAPIERVSAYQCRARTSVILSRRGGSCVAVAESLFAGSPVAMLRNARVGSKAYINAHTGVLMTERRLDRQLSAFVDTSPSYRPREWALTHITCHHASRRLNQLLRDHAHERGDQWTRDIAPLRWRYVPSYVNPTDEARLAPEVARLQQEYGVELERFE